MLCRVVSEPCRVSGCVRDGKWPDSVSGCVRSPADVLTISAKRIAPSCRSRAAAAPGGCVGEEEVCWLQNRPARCWPCHHPARGRIVRCGPNGAPGRAEFGIPRGIRQSVRTSWGRKNRAFGREVAGEGLATPPRPLRSLPCPETPRLSNSEGFLARDVLIEDRFSHSRQDQPPTVRDFSRSDPPPGYSGGYRRGAAGASGSAFAGLDVSPECLSLSWSADFSMVLAPLEGGGAFRDGVKVFCYLPKCRGDFFDRMGQFSRAVGRFIMGHWGCGLTNILFATAASGPPGDVLAMPETTK